MSEKDTLVAAGVTVADVKELLTSQTDFQIVEDVEEKDSNAIEVT